MLNSFKKLISLSLFILFFIPLSSVFAARAPQGGWNRVVRGQTIINDYFAAGDKVTISGIVNGDAYVAGKEVLVDGTVRGDLLAVGGTVVVNGDVGQNIRVIGGNVQINAKVGKNISFAAGTVSIGKDAVVSGNVVGFFGQLTYLGQAMGDLSLAGASIEIDGRNDGNATFRADNIVIGQNTQIFGNLNYESKKEAEIAEGAHIYGTTSFKPANNYAFGNWGKVDKMGTTIAKKGFSFMGFLVAFFIGFICLRVFPRRMLHMNLILAESPFKTLLVGLLIFMMTPLLVLLLSITIVGLPIAIVWVFYLVIAAYFAKIFVGFFLGYNILKKFKQGNRRGWALLLGLLVYGLFRELPYIGWICSFLVVFAGVGMIVREKIYLYRRIRARKIL
jgi:cytoskeletal protein CcmA (bactofilin family)